MSSYQPPGGQQPQAPPAFVPAQDPWGGGFEQGVASVPTDPIPQQQFEQAYPQQPVGSDMWSQPTVPHGGQYTPVPKQRSRAGVIAVVMLAIVVLGGGGGYAAYYLVKQHGTGTTAATNSPTSPATGLDLQKVNLGDCLINIGTLKVPVLQASSCTAANSFKVIKVEKGPNIPKAADGSLDRNTTSVQVCAGLQYNNYYAFWDDDDRTRDVFLCLAANPGTSPTPAGS